MNLNRVHEINLLLLKEVDRICKKHNISYRLEAGTLLGAIRHKGFIPWDDDCDVAFLRDEYEKFLKVIENEKLSDGMVFVRAKNNKKHFHDFVDRLFYTKEIYREGEEFNNRFEGMYRYLWLDFFVLDNIPDNNNLVIMNQKIIYALASHFREGKKFKTTKNIFNNIAMFVVGLFGIFTNLSNIYEMQEKLSKKYANLNDNKLVYCSNYPPIYLDYKMNKEDEKDIIEVDFEDTKLPVLKEYDKILKYYYGDYMKYPPKEKQVPEHLENIW